MTVGVGVGVDMGVGVGVGVVKVAMPLFAPQLLALPPVVVGAESKFAAAWLLECMKLWPITAIFGGKAALL